MVAFVRVDARGTLYHPQLAGHVTFLTAPPMLLDLTQRNPCLLGIILT
jgi:hypothetical protein